MFIFFQKSILKDLSEWKIIWSTKKQAFPMTQLLKYLLDILWGQPIKLIQVVSTSEFHEDWWNAVVFIFLSPRLSAEPQNKNIK